MPRALCSRQGFPRRGLKFARQPYHGLSQIDNKQTNFSCNERRHSHENNLSANQFYILFEMEDQQTEHATDLKSGPFSVLYKAVASNTQVLVNVRNNHKLLGRVKAYDRHMNL